jgi:serine/threonine-protein kinase
VSASRRRSGPSLGSRILLPALVVVLVATVAALAVTELLARRSAAEQVDRALERGGEAGSRILRLYEERLELFARALADDELLALLEADAEEDGEAIDPLPLLEERQALYGFDFLALLDPSARVLARTDRIGAEGESMAADPLLRAAEQRAVTADRGAVAIRRDGDELAYTAMVPLAEEFEVRGYLLAGFYLNDVIAIDIGRASDSQAAFLVFAAGGGTQVAGATLSAGRPDELLAALAAEGAGGRGAAADRRVELSLDDRPWAARLRPLTDVDGDAVGALVTLASRNRPLAPFRLVQLAILAAAGLVLLALLVVVPTVARGVRRPARALTTAVEAARHGDYSTQLEAGGRGEMGALSAAFADLLAELRQRQGVAAWMAEQWRGLPEPAPSPASAAAAARSLALLAVELRRFARGRATADPEEAVDRLGRDLRRIAAAVSARGGHLDALSGHRLLATFSGERQAAPALAAAVEISALLSTPEDAFDEPEPPLVALAVGNVTSGTVTWGEGPEPAVVGMPVQKLEGLLREATPGELVLTREVKSELAEAFAAAGVEPVEQRGAVSPLPLCALGLEAAARVAGLDLAQLTTPAAMARRATASGLVPGAVLDDRFEVLALLSGRAGNDLKCFDRELGDLVALKVLDDERFADGERLEALEAAVQRARQVAHPNVARTYELGRAGELRFVSREYVRGITLRELLDRAGRLPAPVALRLARQLAAALAAAHARTVVHGDLKAATLLVDPQGMLRLMDLGLTLPGGSAGGWLGTGGPEQAPEQRAGRPIDARADLYAAGFVFYELFTGRSAASGVLDEGPTPPRELWPEMPPSLEELILACLARSPADRPASAAAVEELLDNLSA